MSFSIKLNIVEEKITIELEADGKEKGYHCVSVRTEEMLETLMSMEIVNNQKLFF